MSHTTVESLLTAHQSDLRRFAHRMCRTNADADDAVQHAMVQLSEHAGELREGGKLTSWFFTVIKRECMRLIALARRHENPLHERFDRTPDLDLGLALAKSLSALEPELREVLLLRDVEELTGPEVARRLGITLKAMKSRLHRARSAMRETL